ncbi:MAG: 4Fe-4S ferredoxin, partial [Clostridiales bacterium]|nr:4Fe-4S ferredoxin [Clostridiales bacterium]
IKGKYTIQEAADILNMDVKEFYKLFKIPENIPSQTKMKDISGIDPNYDYESVKESLE